MDDNFEIETITEEQLLEEIKDGVEIQDEEYEEEEQ